MLWFSHDLTNRDSLVGEITEREGGICFITALVPHDQSITVQGDAFFDRFTPSKARVLVQPVKEYKDGRFRFKILEVATDEFMR